MENRRRNFTISPIIPVSDTCRTPKRPLIITTVWSRRPNVKTLANAKAASAIRSESYDAQLLRVLPANVSVISEWYIAAGHGSGTYALYSKYKDKWNNMSICGTCMMSAKCVPFFNYYSNNIVVTIPRDWSIRETLEDVARNESCHVKSVWSVNFGWMIIETLSGGNVNVTLHVWSRFNVPCWEKAINTMAIQSRLLACSALTSLFDVHRHDRSKCW